MSSAASAALRKIRYGTALKPTLNARIAAQFPLRDRYPLIDPNTLTSETRPFADLSPWVWILVNLTLINQFRAHAKNLLCRLLAFLQFQL
jgi:hypothetical protein